MDASWTGRATICRGSPLWLSEAVAARCVGIGRGENCASQRVLRARDRIAMHRTWICIELRSSR